MDPQPNNHRQAPNIFSYKSTKKNENQVLGDLIIDLYLSLKHKLKSIQNQNSQSDDLDSEIQQESGVQEEEKQRLQSLSSMVVMDYIKSSIEILLNLKFEEFQNQKKSIKLTQESYINSSRGGHGTFSNEDEDESQKSVSESLRSTISHNDGPPKVYEEMIQALEADVRKHIRVEQQLKLHIEGIEYRIDELENENEKYQKSHQQIEKEKQILEKTLKEQRVEFEQQLDKMRLELEDQEVKHQLQIKQQQEIFESQKEQFKTEIQRLEQLKLSYDLSPQHKKDEYCHNCSKIMKLQLSGSQKFSKEFENSNVTTTVKKKKDSGIENSEKRNSNKSNKKLFFKRTNISYCSCNCSKCQISHVYQEQQHAPQQLSTTSHYKKMQQSFLERPLIANVGPFRESLKISNNGGSSCEKRSSVSKKRNGNSSSTTHQNTLNLSCVANNTPDKQSNLKGLLSALNLPIQSASSQGRTKNISNAITQMTNSGQSTNFCCHQQLSRRGNNSSSYWTQQEDNPYLQGSSNTQTNQGTMCKTENQNSSNKNNMFFEHSSNTSIQAMNKNLNLPLNQVLDQDNFMFNQRQATNKTSSNQYLLDMNEPEEISDSILNSHRRSRSQNLHRNSAKQSKSERKKGARLVQFRQGMLESKMPIQFEGKNNINISKRNQKRISQAANETTPLKNLSNSHMQQQNIMSTEEKQKLFNSFFLKELNNSFALQNTHGAPASAKKKKKHNQTHDMRMVSGSSSRPRSQLTMTNNPNQNNNYSFVASGGQSAHNKQIKYKQQAQINSNLSQSRNNISKLKEFFLHNTFNQNNIVNTHKNMNAQILEMANQIKVQQKFPVKKSGGGNENYQFSPNRKR